MYFCTSGGLVIKLRSLSAIDGFLLMMPGGSSAPDGMEKPDQGRDQQNAHRNAAGNPKSMQPGREEMVHIPPQAILHGIIDASPRHHRDDPHNQVDGDRGLMDAGHQFGVRGHEYGGQKILEDIVVQKGKQQIGKPTQRGSQRGEEQNPSAQVIPHAVPYAGGEYAQAGDQDLFDH